MFVFDIPNIAKNRSTYVGRHYSRMNKGLFVLLIWMIPITKVIFRQCRLLHLSFR